MFVQLVNAQDLSVYETDHSKGVIFPAKYFDSERNTYFTPTESEVLNLETKLLCASAEELGTKNKQQKLEYFENCYRQYVGVISANEKIIYITFLPKKDIDSNILYKDWKRTFIYGEYQIYFTAQDAKFHQINLE
jgi:hypothetical protein